MSELVTMRVRVCTVCKHEECPCCGGWCDSLEPTETAEDPEDRSFCDCGPGGKCVYVDPRDEEGFKRLGEAMVRAGELCGVVTKPEGYLVLRHDETDEEEETGS